MLLAASCGRIGFQPAPETAPDTATAGALSGGFIAQTADVDLSSLGTADWSHWGLIDVTSIDHKQPGGQLAITTAGPVMRYLNNTYGVSWTDGTPDAAVTNTLTGLFVQQVGSAIEISAPQIRRPGRFTYSPTCTPRR